MRIIKSIINLLSGYNVEEKISTLNKQIRVANNQKNGYVSSLNQLRSKLSTAEEKIDVLTQNNQALNAQVEEIERQLTEVRALYNEAKEKKEMLVSRLRQKQGTILARTNENERLATRLEQVTYALNENISIRETLENTDASLRQEIEQLKCSMREKDENFNALFNENESLKRMCQSLADELALARERNANLQNQNDFISSRLSTVVDEKDALYNQLCAKESEIMSLQNQLAILSEHTNDTFTKNEELQALEKQNQKLEEQLSDRTRELAISIDSTNQKGEKIRSLESALIEVRNANGELNEKITILERTITLMTNSVKDQQKTISSNNHLINELKDKLDIYEKKVEDDCQQVETNFINSYVNEDVSSDNETIQEEVIEEHHPQKAQEPTHRSNNKPIKKPKKSKVDEVIDLSQGSIKDFPFITNDSNRKVNRSIEYVRDENDNIIYAEEFFDRTAEEISDIARKMVEFEIKGESYWTCGLCRSRVKIAHRLYHGTESLFFIHAKKDSDCPWVKPAEKSDDNNKDVYQYVADDDNDEDLPEDITIEDYKHKSRILKEKIFDLLLTRESQDMGISNVSMDRIVKSNMPYMKWRRPDISFEFNGRKMVIELQKRSQTLTTIVDKDVFYRLNDTHVIWIFGSDSDTSYDYMRQSNYKNTMFDNHRNVFVFDKDAQEASEQKNFLLLKCNWLEANDDWSILLKNSGTNGKHITFTDLIFDDEYCKPYYFDANKAYFQMYPEACEAYLKSRVSREDLLKSLEEKWTRDPNYEEAQNYMRLHGLKAMPFKSNNLWGFRHNTTTLMQPIFDEEPRLLANGYYLVKQQGKLGLLNSYAEKIIDWDGTFMYEDMDFDKNSQLVFIKNNNCWGVADMKGNVIINPIYQFISPWDKTIYRVKSNNKWGLCDISGRHVSECKYDSIDFLVNGKAKVKLVNPLDITQVLTGYINNEGDVLYDEKIEQPDGLFVIQQFGRWGIVDSNNNTILQSVYEQIKPWSESLYRIKQNQKWGIINVKTNEYLINPKYDYITDLVSGVAKISYVGVESHIDVTGKEVLQESIILQSGLQKTKKSGKWGIVREDGTEIVPHKYDEIGSFRGRLIGIINQRITKLDAYYDYPIYISGKYINTTTKGYWLDISGVRCYLLKSWLSKNGIEFKHICDESGFCNNIAFANLDIKNKNYVIRFLPIGQLTKPLNKGDMKETFMDGELLTGTVTSFMWKNINGVKKTKRVYVKFADGRQTRVPVRFFVNSKKNIEDYKKNDTITLRKYGFDDELDQTLWEVI